MVSATPPHGARLATHTNMHACRACSVEWFRLYSCSLSRVRLRPKVHGESSIAVLRKPIVNCKSSLPRPRRIAIQFRLTHSCYCNEQPLPKCSGTHLDTRRSHPAPMEQLQPPRQHTLPSPGSCRNGTQMREGAIYGVLLCSFSMMWWGTGWFYDGIVFARTSKMIGWIEAQQCR
jgi:hypothetical protein